ncbi:hypothetical protein QR680_010656 [Steinernema hermaphroditum]|uniref:Uncharacterized protein n=1 Tax=Steinernema hermaphroditum TaxID=289476 RepID=A0AA39MC57_9BILA|nr:hypothetical protein QR680_010656 [Steinernema hermaphroditum]
MNHVDSAETAKHLTGLWRLAAEKYAKRVHMCSVLIWKFTRYLKTGKLPNSMDELLAMDRRFIRIHKVVLRNVHIEEDRTSIITTEDIIKRLIPFLNAQSLRLSIVSFSMRAEDKNVAMYLELFQQHVTFGCAGLKYLGPQSEDYLAFQAKNNSVLAGLSLSGWPKSDRVEDLVIELLRRPKLVLISLSGGRGQIVTMRTIEVGFKLWHESGKPINMSVDTNVSEEELLSLPVPEDVTVTTKRITHKYGVTLLIRWRKENTPDLIFTFEYSSTGLVVTAARPEFRCYNGTKSISRLDEIATVNTTVACPTKQCFAKRTDVFKLWKRQVIEGFVYGCHNVSYSECGDGENMLPKESPEERKQAAAQGIWAMYCCNTTLCNESLEKAIRNLASSSSTLSPIFIGLLIFFAVYRFSH